MMDEQNVGILPGIRPMFCRAADFYVTLWFWWLIKHATSVTINIINPKPKQQTIIKPHSIYELDDKLTKRRLKISTFSLNFVC